MSDTNHIERTAPTEDRKKVGRPRKYHTLEEYAEAQKRYYENKKAKIQQQKQQQREIDAQKSDSQKRLTKMLQDNVYTEEQMMMLLEILEKMPPQITPNTPTEAPPQSDTDS